MSLLGGEESNDPGINGCRLLNDREIKSVELGRPWTWGFISSGGGQRGLPGESDSWAEILFKY